MPIQAGASPAATITAEELAALIAERNALAGALRVATIERDLALERLRSLQRQLFAAKSEARGTDQKDLFLNEAEALAPTDQTPPAETEEEESTPVAGHQRKKRGRKPLDPALPREIVRHELPERRRLRRVQRPEGFKAIGNSPTAHGPRALRSSAPMQLLQAQVDASSG